MASQLNSNIIWVSVQFVPSPPYVESQLAMLSLCLLFVLCHSRVVYFHRRGYVLFWLEKSNIWCVVGLCLSFLVLLGLGASVSVTVAPAVRFLSEPVLWISRPGIRWGVIGSAGLGVVWWQHWQLSLSWPQTASCLPATPSPHITLLPSWGAGSRTLDSFFCSPRVEAAWLSLCPPALSCFCSNSFMLKVGFF